MAEENKQIIRAAEGGLSSEELNTVSGGMESEEDYVVTTDKLCPYCGSTQVYKAGMQKNFGFTMLWREYKCRKCSRHFWHEEYC